MVDTCPPVFPFGRPLHTGVTDTSPSAYLNLLSGPPLPTRVLHEGRAFSGYQTFRNHPPDAPMPAINAQLFNSST